MHVEFTLVMILRLFYCLQPFQDGIVRYIDKFFFKQELGIGTE